MRLLLAIKSIHEFSSISIDFLPAFTQSGLNVDFFVVASFSNWGVQKHRRMEAKVRQVTSWTQGVS